jgi:polyhydroxyalkanoate synthesis regulator phasin
MTQFTDIKRSLEAAAKEFIGQFADKAGGFIDEMEKAGSMYEEQAVVIASLKETVTAQQQEITDLTADYESRIDAIYAEKNAIESSLAQKTKDFDALARAVSGMKISGRAIDVTAAHALNLINRSRVGDKIVTEFRGSPQRRPAPSDADSLSTILHRADEPRQANG